MNLWPSTCHAQLARQMRWEAGPAATGTSPGFFLEWRCRFQANHKHEHRVPKTHMPANLPRQITWYQTHPAKFIPQDSKNQ